MSGQTFPILGELRQNVKHRARQRLREQCLKVINHYPEQGSVSLLTAATQSTFFDSQEVLCV